MSRVILTTKLTPPRPRPRGVHRPRLIARLCGRAERTLTLLSAPAGFGKTTLLADWLQGAPNVAWLTLDDTDNDPVRFWTCVIAALQSARPELGRAAARLLQRAGAVGPAARVPLHAMLNLLINEIAGNEVPLVLVFDDYHVIGTPKIHEGMAYLLDHLPRTMHVAIATRADPALPLGRLRARNEIVELRAADLAFTPEEAAAFLNETMVLGLSADDVAALAARTEGWIAGLQMAALALEPTQRGADEAALVRGLARTERTILDYLTDEVLAQQAPEVESFLLRTSILDRLTAPLCDALLEGTPRRATAAELLQVLERTNLFIEPLDATLTWYRIHPLFADMLRKRLAARQPELIRELHCRAAAWWADHGNVTEAIDHALAGADYAHAAALVTATIETTLNRSEHRMALRWLSALPEDVIRTHPDLCVYHAWTLLLEGQAPEQVALRLAQAREAEPVDEIKGATATIEALLAVYRGDLSGSLRRAESALGLLPAHATFLRTVAADVQGIAHLSLGDLPAAEADFAGIVEIAQAAGNTMMGVAALCNLAGVQIVRGQLHAASQTYRQALIMSTERGQRLPVAARALLGLGEVAREWNDLDTAKVHLSEALMLCERYGEIGNLVCALTLARVRWAQGQLGAAHALVDRAEAIAAASRATQIDDRLVAASRARLWIAEGRLDEAAGWAQSVGTAAPWRESSNASDYNVYEAEHAILVRLALARGQADEALSELALLIETAERSHRTRRLIELLILQALAQAWQGPNGAAAADATLQRALALAEPEGYRRTFIDEGPALRDLLARVPEASEMWAYAQELLVALPAETTGAPIAPARPGLQPPVEPLSEREMEVLELIAAGHTNREIGDALYIALDTVKGHTREIYGKLDVHSRTQAVAKARALGLLPRA